MLLQAGSGHQIKSAENSATSYYIIFFQNDQLGKGTTQKNDSKAWYCVTTSYFVKFGLPENGLYNTLNFTRNRF